MCAHQEILLSNNWNLHFEIYLDWLRRVIENSRLSSDWRSKPNADILQYLLAKWVMVFLVGLSTALVGYGLNMAIENVCGFKFLVTLHFMNTDR